MEQLLSLLSETVPQGQTLEQVARPLLALLGRFTGMESTYLASADSERGVVRIEFARNVGDMTVSEGLEVPWEDTLCKRALDEGRHYADDVMACWGDSELARALGIRAYISAPVRALDGKLLGALCAASATKVAPTAEAELVLMLISGVLGAFLERELLLEQLRSANAELSNLALIDALTGLYNRRAILGELERLLAQGRRERRHVLVGVIDLDDFKQVNDTHGHQIGDQFLCAVSARLKGALRAAEPLGRTGGDEFIAIALGDPAVGDQGIAQAVGAWQARLMAASEGDYELDDGRIGFHYPGASVGVIAVPPGAWSADEAITRADAAMYRVKQQRKSRR